MQRAHRNREFRDVLGVGDAQAVLPHVLDMLGPGIDERHVLARLHHMGAGIPADRTRSDDSYFPTHALLPGFLRLKNHADTVLNRHAPVYAALNKLWSIKQFAWEETRCRPICASSRVVKSWRGLPSAPRR